MKFKTISGTEYLLKDIETHIEATGEPPPSVGPQGIPVIVWYIGELARVGKPLTDLMSGGSFETDEDFYSVKFSSMPVIGERFFYYHPAWYSCYSTKIVEIKE